MIPLSFGDIALLNHLLEERGTRYQVRWKDCFNACLEPRGNAALPRSSSGKPWGWWRGSTGKRALPWCSPRTNCFFR